MHFHIKNLVTKINTRSHNLLKNTRQRNTQQDQQHFQHDNTSTNTHTNERSIDTCTSKRMGGWRNIKQSQIAFALRATTTTTMTMKRGRGVLRCYTLMACCSVPDSESETISWSVVSSPPPVLIGGTSSKVRVRER